MESPNICFNQLFKKKISRYLFTERLVTIRDFRMESNSGEKQQRSSVASQFFTGTEDAAMDMTTNEKVSLFCSRTDFDNVDMDHVYSLKNNSTVKNVSAVIFVM